MKKQKQCYLCGDSNFIKRPGSVRDNERLDIFECSKCGLVFLSSFDHIEDNFYENSQMHDNQTMPDINTWLNETERDDKRRFEFFKPALVNSRLLDFGCGPGGFLLKAKKLAKIAHGVEPEKRLKNYYKSCGVNVFQSVDAINDNDYCKEYDIITLFHVLEHIPDPRSILIKLSKILADGGRIIVEVPNAEDALLTLYKSESFSKFTYWSCHLFFFTIKTLEMLCSQIKLKVNYIKQIQRYPLSNHLYWLSNGSPGGHEKWHCLDSIELNRTYEKQLASIGKCDTLIASISNH